MNRWYARGDEQCPDRLHDYRAPHLDFFRQPHDLILRRVFDLTKHMFLRRRHVGQFAREVACTTSELSNDT